MKRRMTKRLTIWLVALSLLVAACGSTAATTTTTTQSPPATIAAPTTTAAPPTSTTTEPPTAAAFPVTVTVGGAEITLAEKPTRIISLSPTATETLFAIGAGDQVVAVDEYSTYPEDAPFTDLSGYTPNIEALASYDPDLIVVAFDPEGMITAAFGDNVPVASQFPATGREDVLAQIEQLGALTGHRDEALALSGDIAARWDLADQADANDASVYIEVDTTFYAASSNSFMGAALTGLGYTNIADAADTNGGGFPQLSAEAIIQASPDVIIVGTDYGTTVADIAARPGWDSISALINDQVIVIPSDISSRWGPRFIDYIETMAALASAPVTVNR